MSRFIRAVRKHDLELLASVYANAFSTNERGESWSIEAAHRLLSAAYRRQSDLFFACYEEHTPLGAIFASIKPWWDGNHLAEPQMFVSPRYQSQGIGTSLIKQIIAEAKKRYSITKVEAVALRSGSDFTPGYYKRLGFSRSPDQTGVSASPGAILSKIDRKPL